MGSPLLLSPDVEENFWDVVEEHHRGHDNVLGDGLKDDTRKKDQSAGNARSHGWIESEGRRGRGRRGK